MRMSLHPKKNRLAVGGPTHQTPILSDIEHMLHMLAASIYLNPTSQVRLLFDVWKHDDLGVPTRLQ